MTKRLSPFGLLIIAIAVAAINGIIDGVSDALGLEFDNSNTIYAGNMFHGGHSDRL